MGPIFFWFTHFKPSVAYKQLTGMDKFIVQKRQVSGEATCARETPSTSEASSSIEATTTGEPANMSCDDDEAPSPSSNE